MKVMIDQKSHFVESWSNGNQGQLSGLKVATDNNNYSPKARWLSVNKNRDEVKIFIHDNHLACNCFSIIS
jgi:hypothetical protein